MGPDGFLATAITCAIGGIATLRLGWSRRARSIPLNTAGWGLIVLAAMAGWLAAGAWGMAVATLCGMGAAFAILAYSLVTAPPSREKASNRRAGMLPEGGEPLRLRARFATFTLVVVLGAAGGIVLALASRALAVLMGAEEADANVIALFVAPLAWATIAFFLLMQRNRRKQWLLLAGAILPALPLILVGSIR